MLLIVNCKIPIFETKMLKRGRLFYAVTLKMMYVERNRSVLVNNFSIPLCLAPRAHDMQMLEIFHLYWCIWDLRL